MATDTRFDGPGPDAQYQQALQEGRLMLQHCEDCAAVRFPPALVCRACGSPRLQWRVSPGLGSVYSLTTVRDRAGDYNVALVDLEGGARMMSRVEDVAPDAVRIGQHVRARIVAGEEPFVVFAPAEGGTP
ncbi:Zn-ribbon domain-containing OB-fold protein [Variovorax paradoxus]|uniref:Zn-ribbon domain-containing OB-fold protein n=1 Tax=Variovorax paradoxus TaxID=34073 RepID=UPI0019341B70|nr:OB-fold domain-containing protein [Variovorax paradoxus]